MLLVYERKIKFRTSDYDKYDQIKIQSLLDLFQDYAGEHANMLGIGYQLMIEKKLIWVLVSSKVDYLGEIKYGKDYIIRTWPREKGRIDFIRDYEIEDENGNIVVKASSKWVVVNSETRRIVRTGDIEYDGEIYPKNNYDDVKKLKVNIPHNKQFVKSYKTMNSDIDHNGHMNNSKYVELIFNCNDVEKGKYFTNIHIDYLHETMLGDTIDLFKFKDDNYIYYVGYVNNEESFIAQMKEE